jgi:hypothetical protein
MRDDFTDARQDESGYLTPPKKLDSVDAAGVGMATEDDAKTYFWRSARVFE